MVVKTSFQTHLFGPSRLQNLVSTETWTSTQHNSYFMGQGASSSSVQWPVGPLLTRPKDRDHTIVEVLYPHRTAGPLTLSTGIRRHVTLRQPRYRRASRKFQQTTKHHHIMRHISNIHIDSSPMTSFSGTCALLLLLLPGSVK